MPAIDFTEIAEPGAGAHRDDFELFARDFLELLGFTIIRGPNRGPDAGRDLIVEELRTGVAGETRIRWLVSCKHKAHAGKSVTPDDEPDIHDRMKTHGCGGFLAVYSTIPSSGLAAKLHPSKPSFEVRVYDPEEIERRLLSSSNGVELAKRFFPNSVRIWSGEHPSPAKVFADPPDLACFYCNKSLLTPKPHGIIVLWVSSEPGKEHTEHVYWCCKGACDKALEAEHRQPGLVDGWKDLTDLVIPTVYIHWITVSLNEFQGGMTYSDRAFKRTKHLLLNLFPLVSRHLTIEERDRVSQLTKFNLL